MENNSDENSDRLRSFVGRNFWLLAGAGMGALLPLLLLQNSNLRVLKNVERWIEKSSTLEADQQLLARLKEDSTPLAKN